MTKDQLKDKFCALIYSPHLFSLLWGLIEPYLDESKFISQDEKCFREWYSERFLLDPKGPAASPFREAWFAARKK